MCMQGTAVHQACVSWRTSLQLLDRLPFHLVPLAARSKCLYIKNIHEQHVLLLLPNIFVTCKQTRSDKAVRIPILLACLHKVVLTHNIDKPARQHPCLRLGQPLLDRQAQ